MSDDHKRKFSHNNIDSVNDPLLKRSRTQNHSFQNTTSSQVQNLQSLSSTEIEKIKKKFSILLSIPKIEIDEACFEKLYASLAQYTKCGSEVLKQFLQCDAISILKVHFR
jgi:hypothetical protein